MFEWCSIAEITISSPRPTRERPNVAATRLIASVVPRTKTISPRRPRVQEPADGGARLLERVGRALAEPVHAAMHVGVLLDVELRQSIDHDLRLLRRRRVVEIDERLAVNVLAQEGKVPADRRRRPTPPFGSLALRGSHPDRAQGTRILRMTLKLAQSIG